MDNDLITSYMHAQYGDNPHQHPAVLTLDKLTASAAEQLQLIILVSRDRRYTTRQRFVYDQLLESGALTIGRRRIQDSILPPGAEPETHPIDGIVATLADTYAILRHLDRAVSPTIEVESNGVEQRVAEYLREQVTPDRLKQQLEPPSIYQLLGDAAAKFAVRLSRLSSQAAGRRVAS